MILKNFYDLLVPLHQIHENLSYKNMNGRDKMNILLNNKKLIQDFDDDIDNYMLHALGAFENLSIFVLWGKNKNEAYQYFHQMYSDDYLLYGLKHMTVEDSYVEKILFQMLYTQVPIKTKRELKIAIEMHYPFLHSYSNKTIDVSIFIVCKRSLRVEFPKKDVIHADFIVVHPQTREMTWIVATLFLSSTTMAFIQKQNIDHLLKREWDKSKAMFSKYREWLVKNISISQRQQFTLFSSVVLYLIGHREMNDIDLYIHYVPELTRIKLDDFAERDYSFIEYSLKGSDDKWPAHWNTWLDMWAQKCGAKYFEEILGNPKYHFYFAGMKCISLECDIVRRLARNRPNAYADLISFRKRYSYQISIPPIPVSREKYILLSTLNEAEKESLVKGGAKINEQNRELVVMEETDIPKFIQLIIGTLEKRYRMIFTTEEIKKEVGMYQRPQAISILVEKKKAIPSVPKLAIPSAPKLESPCEKKKAIPSAPKLASPCEKKKATDVPQKNCKNDCESDSDESSSDDSDESSSDDSDESSESDSDESSSDESDESSSDDIDESSSDESDESSESDSDESSSDDESVAPVAPPPPQKITKTGPIKSLKK